nr:hypothetical protein Iba_chr11bCG4810 [Ipomoea batatas]GMD58580.1 hypothetical protein Iba_chr11fCG6910 [Ipomoea batatas]
MALISIVKVSDMGVMASFAVFSASSSAPAMMVVSSIDSSPPFPAYTKTRTHNISGNTINLSHPTKDRLLQNHIIPVLKSDQEMTGGNVATGNQNHMRTRTAGATAAPMAKPYLEQTDCVTSRSTMLIDMRPNVNPDIIPANTTSRRLTAMYIKNSGSQHCNCFFSASAMD